jgi:hypothetical protein
VGGWEAVSHQLFQDHSTTPSVLVSTSLFQKRSMRQPRSYPCGAPNIGLVVVVLTAVGFNDQAMTGAGEIGDVPADRVLSTKAVAAQAAVAEH